MFNALYVSVRNAERAPIVKTKEAKKITRIARRTSETRKNITKSGPCIVVYQK